MTPLGRHPAEDQIERRELVIEQHPAAPLISPADGMKAAISPVNSGRKHRTWYILSFGWLLISSVWLFSASIPAVASLSLPARVVLGQSRFSSRWRVVLPPKMPTVEESNGRILYSPVRAGASEGLGHAMATINGDVSAALRLRVAYSHRVGQHGSLTLADARAVEKFFGWGDGQETRDSVSMACKKSVASFMPSECVTCVLPKSGGKWNNGEIDSIVNLPGNLTYSYHSLPEPERNQLLSQFLEKNNRPNTMFQMPPELCAKSPAQSHFGNDVRAYFYTQYWKRRSLQPIFPRFDDSELSIAIHARRGDFFVAHRPMTTISAFGRSIRHIMRMVQAKGGAFSRMRVAVVIYSEGIPLEDDGKWKNHDVSKMKRSFLDTTGVPRDVHWVRERIVGGRAELFPNGVRVEMRIATETLLAAHEMIAADIFLGSLSGLSMHVVASLSRSAIIALPSTSKEHWPGHCTYWPPTGDFHNLTTLRNSWNEYADRYAVAGTRALMVGRFT